MQTEILDGKEVPVIDVVKSISGKPETDKGVPANADDAVISTINQEGVVQNDDVTATREVISATTLPLSYQYDEKQMLANVSTAISADVEDLTERELLEDETFGYASKKMYRSLRGEDFKGTDEEATQYGIDLMRRVENNLIELGEFSARTQNMTPDDAKVALYMMDMFEAKDFTGRGFAEALGYMGQDPTTFIGLGTFGFGFAGKEAVKQTGKQGIKAALQKMAFSNASVGAIEGGGYTAAFEHGRQTIRESAGQGYDTGSVGLNAAIGSSFGAAAGKYLPEIFDYAGEKVAKWSAAKNFRAEVQAAADAGDSDAIQVLADMELLDNHFDGDGFLRRKIDEFEQTRVGQVVTGVQRVVPENATQEEKDLIIQHNLTSSNLAHADRLDGLAVPSLAITNKGTPLTSFGEITMLGDEKLATPTAKHKVFGSDIYSPRYPAIVQQLSRKQEKEILDDLSPFAEMIGRDTDQIDTSNLNRDMPMRVKFLDSKDIEIPVTKEEFSALETEQNDFFSDVYDSSKMNKENAANPEFEKKMIEWLELRGASQDMFTPEMLQRAPKAMAGGLAVLNRRANKAGMVNQFETSKAINNIIPEYEDEYEKFVRNYYKEMGAKETIYAGTDSQGRQKWIPHNIDNVVKKLKKDLRGGEGFSAGTATARAKLTPQFKTLKQIQKAKGKLVGGDEFDKVRDEMDDALYKLVGEINLEHTDKKITADDMLNAIDEAATTKDIKAELEFYLKEATPEMVKKTEDFMQALREMPTEYFESKRHGLMNLDEFSYAIIPTDSSPETKAILDKKGIEYGEYDRSISDDRIEKIKAVAEQRGLLFALPALLYLRAEQTEGENNAD